VALIAPEYVAILDPFTKEAQEIARASPPFESMPQEIAEQAIDRVQWKSSKEMLVDSSAGAVKAEILSFYMMCQGIAAVSYPYSREVRLVTNATKETIRYRMYDLFKRGHEDFCLDVVKRSFKLMRLEHGDKIKLGSVEIPRDDYFKLRDRQLADAGIKEKEIDDRVLPQYVPKYAMRWSDLVLLLRHRRAELAKLYIVNGWAVMTPHELWNFFADFVAVKTEEYIASIYERFSDTGTPTRLLQIGEKIAALVPPEAELRERFMRVPRGRLRPEFFPPCAKKAFGGVGAGARNYAITVLLTSFLSYARVSPPPAATRMADIIKDISIVRDEIAPPISEAAERCNPPFFKDQPQEKASVFYHMGFGMTTEPTLADSGRSKWYRVPNCSKIQVAAPLLCEPDEFCRSREIKNPLTYYYKRFGEQARMGVGE